MASIPLLEGNTKGSVFYRQNWITALKKYRNIWIAIIVFFLLVNTHKYWSYDLGLTGIVYLLIFVLFIVLAVVSIVQLIKLFREKFQDYNRRVMTAAVITALFLVYEWPDGILPGTAPTDKFENLTLENTGLDLHGYSYVVINDSIEDTELFLGDYYYELKVQYDFAEFAEIVERIRQTDNYDQIPMFRARESPMWDSLNPAGNTGLWDEDEKYIWFVENPETPEAMDSKHVVVYFDKTTHQACVYINQM